MSMLTHLTQVVVADPITTLSHFAVIWLGLLAAFMSLRFSLMCLSLTAAFMCSPDDYHDYEE
jgi:hypothetical protein